MDKMQRNWRNSLPILTTLHWTFTDKLAKKKKKKNKNHNLIDKNYEYDRTKNTAQTLILKHTKEAFTNKKVKVQY